MNLFGASIRNLLIIGALILAGCSSTASPVNAGAVAPAPVFTLGTGDKVRVSVYGEDPLTGDYTVAPDGTLAMPLIGTVPAAGQSIPQLQDSIAARLRNGYMLDPRVSIDVLTFRPFYILGEVNKPGQYPYVDQLTVAQAVAIAGGFTYRANTGTVFIRHKDSPGEQAYTIKNGKPAWVLPGDTIRVGERYF